MSKTHSVIKGDLLGNLAIQYLGSWDKYVKIVQVNPQLKGRGKAIDGSPLIYPGDILIIPDADEDKEKNAPEEIDADDGIITVIIDGKKFIFFSDYELNFPIDSFDTFSCSSPFDSSQSSFRDAFRPFTYKPCKIYYGKNLAFQGTMLSPSAGGDASSSVLNLTSYAKCGVLNECPLPITKYPMEFNNQDLKKITNSMIEFFGLSAEFKESVGNAFKKVCPEAEEEILPFLIKLAEQKGLLITNNSQGNLLFWKTATGSPIASIKEGETPYLSCSPNFDPQKFYSHITGIAPSSVKKKSDKYTFENKYLIKKGITRPYTFKISDPAEDHVKEDLKTAVTAKVGRMFASACPYQLKLQGHRDKSGNLWQKNTLITVLAAGAMIYRETTFLIKHVNISRKPVINGKNDGGDTTILDLVLPGAYSGQVPEVFPWEED